MKRLELIACEAVRAELIEGLEKAIPSIEYTLMADIHGKGTRSSKDGSQVWPELNFMLIAYLDDAAVSAANDAIHEVTKRFPSEGIFAGIADAEKIR